MKEKVYCKVCTHRYSTDTCTRDAKWSKFTENWDKLKFRDPNKDGKCPHYAILTLGNAK